MILDSLEQMQKLDKQGVYMSINSLPDQMASAWKAMEKIELPPDFKLARNVVVSGMGGSALGARMIKSLYETSFRVPFEICNDYRLPGYVDSNTLVVLSSYSGNTEETISTGLEAKSRNAMVFGITTGGKLKEFLKKEEYPAYIVDPKDNPSGQPRMSLGYSTVALLALLVKCSIISLTSEQMTQGIATTEKFSAMYSAREKLTDNMAKILAQKLQNKIAMLVSSGHLYEVAHTFKNQLNENTKAMALHFAIPEMNHHLLEGLKFPAQDKNKLYFLFFQSKLYSDRVKLRYPITQDVINKQGYEYSMYELESETKIEQMFEVLVLGSYVSFYLSMLEGIDPSPIPWVDYFKEKLS